MASQPQGRGKPKAPKAKVLQGLRNTQAEQLSKLQQKYQFEQDLLEDIRAYSKQRSALEKEYSQNLQKLNSNFLQKRAFPADTDTDSTHRLPDAIWRRLLEESENYSKKRLEVSDGLQAKVVEEIKTFKANKAQAFKKCQDLIQKIQEEVFETAREMSKSKKSYIEAEKLAQVASEQAADAEDKLKNKNKKFFQSKATLEKNMTKTTNRKDVSEKKATSARNDYLLNIAATNAHMTRYYCVDLQEILDTVYGTYYETIRECFLNVGKFEVGSALTAKKGFEHLLSEAAMIEKDYCVQHFLENNPVFTKVVHYDFEPWKKDKVSMLSIDGNAGLALNKEARKLSMRFVREQKAIKNKQKVLSSLLSTNSSEILSASEQAQDPEQNPDNIREEIRKAEIIWLKSDACLNLMKDAGVNVDEWLKSANSLSVANSELSSSQTSLEKGTNFMENSEWNDEEWDMDDTFAGESYSDEDANSLASSCSLPSSCVALYSFEASTSEELSIAENEELEVIEKDGEGWVKGRNKNGEIGYFPESYIDFTIKKHPSVSSTQSGSVHSGSCTDSSLGTSPASWANHDQSYICLVRALFDYEANGDDEISFNEGDIIKVTRKDDNGVDDGFWEGQVNCQFGMFPSLVVEEVEGCDCPAAKIVNTGDCQDSIYSVKASNKIDDYIELPKDYVPGTGQASVAKDINPNNSSYIQPVRKAPEPPSFAMDRRRVQTENLSTMTKPDISQGYQHSNSQEYPHGHWNSNHNQMLSANAQTANYVNVSDSPEGNGKTTGGKPPKPPPPTANSKRTYSKSAV